VPFVRSKSNLRYICVVKCCSVPCATAYTAQRHAMFCQKAYGVRSLSEDDRRRRAVSGQRPQERLAQLDVLPAVDQRVYRRFAKVQHHYELQQM
jgi:hypothetical protein